MSPVFTCKRIKLWVHNDDYSQREVLIRPDVIPGLHSGGVLELVQPTQSVDLKDNIESLSPPKRVVVVYEEPDREFLNKSSLVQVSLLSFGQDIIQPIDLHLDTTSISYWL